MKCHYRNRQGSVVIEIIVALVIVILGVTTVKSLFDLEIERQSTDMKRAELVLSGKDPASFSKAAAAPKARCTAVVRITHPDKSRVYSVSVNPDFFHVNNVGRVFYLDDGATTIQVLSIKIEMESE